MAFTATKDLILPATPIRLGDPVVAVIRRVPAGIGQRVEDSGLVGDTEAAADRHLPVPERIPCEPEAGSDVVVVPFRE